MAVPSTFFLAWIYCNTYDAVTTETILACTVISTRPRHGADGLVMTSSPAGFGAWVDLTAECSRTFIPSIALTAVEYNGQTIEVIFTLDLNTLTPARRHTG